MATGSRAARAAADVGAIQHLVPEIKSCRLRPGAKAMAGDEYNSSDTGAEPPV
jgi:hypothetical protein